MSFQIRKTPTITVIIFVLILALCGLYWLAPQTLHNSHDRLFPSYQETDRDATKETISTATTKQKIKSKEIGVKDERQRLKYTPNIIFAMADDLGWGDVEYNSGKALTPNLNKMAKSENSILLQRYYSGGPVCSPTRGTVLTGRNHNRYCVWHANRGLNKTDFEVPEGMPLPPSEISVGEVLRRAGYATALFGKWHLGDFKPVKSGNKKWPVSHPGQHGFEHWQATLRSARTCTLNCGCFESAECILGHTQKQEPHPYCTNYYTINNQSKQLEAWPNPIALEDSHFIWSLAEKFIREQVKLKKQFFLYLPFHAVHKNYIATKKYRDIYLKKHFNSEQADYYGAISAMDEIIGQIRVLLQELHIKENTLLWFSSDNGPANHTPGVTNGLRGHKGDLYEGGIRVPAIIEWPNVIKSNKESWFPVVSSDFLPTVYDMLRVKPVDDRPLDGISILPFLQGEVEYRNHSIYWAFPVLGNFNGQYSVAISGDQYKLIAEYNNSKVINHEFYDLVNDMKENKDLKHNHTVLCRQFLSGIEEWRMSVMNSVQQVGCLKYSFFL